MIDAPSDDGGGELPDFIKHRHDQSIFSVLIKKAMQSSSRERPLVVTKEFRTWIGHHAISKRILSKTMAVLAQPISEEEK